MNKLELEQRRKRIESLVKIGAFGLVGFLVAPFVFIAIKGLIGLLIAGAIGGGAMFMAPAVAAKFANWRLKAIKAEASRNPVETLQNEYNRRQNALKEFHSRITTFIAERNNFQDKLDGFKQEYPQDTKKFEDILDKMNRLLAIRQNKYKQAEKGLQEFEGVIERAGAIWEMGNAAAALTTAAGMSEDDFFAKLQTETALDSVQRNLNTAFAELETSLMEEENPAPEGMAEAKAA